MNTKNVQLIALPILPAVQSGVQYRYNTHEQLILKPVVNSGRDCFRCQDTHTTMPPHTRNTLAKSNGETKAKELGNCFTSTWRHGGIWVLRYKGVCYGVDNKCEYQLIGACVWYRINSLVAAAMPYDTGCSYYSKT